MKEQGDGDNEEEFQREREGEQERCRLTEKVTETHCRQTDRQTKKSSDGE